MQIHSSAEVSPSARIGQDVSIWHFTRVREGVSIGNQVNVGANVYIGPSVTIGNQCKIQNGAQIYEPAILEDGVFIGPSVILTNDHNPRSINSDLTLKSDQDWEKVGVVVCRGASIGAGAICVAPIRIGAWSMIAAGSVVISDTLDYSLMAGVPAKQIGWVGESGISLQNLEGTRWRCPKTGSLYEVSTTGTLVKSK
jgi:acetyltransferase-like isoleucine patch superfamily enzyme